jgi:polycomb protein EED
MHAKMDCNWELPTLRGTVRLGAPTKSRLSSIQFYDVNFYPYTAPGLDPVFAVCGGPFTVICRCILNKNSTIEVLRWFEDEENASEHGAPDDKQLNYNSVVWSRARNGDPLVCVTGDSRIKVLNVRTGKLATVRSISLIRLHLLTWHVDADRPWRFCQRPCYITSRPDYSRFREH